jgi:hypothetical protein
MSVTDRDQAARLVAGQRFDRAAFHERYEQTPEGVRAELIGGVVCMPSPSSYSHSRRNAALAAWLVGYAEATP